METKECLLCTKGLDTFDKVLEWMVKEPDGKIIPFICDAHLMMVAEEDLLNIPVEQKQ